MKNRPTNHGISRRRVSVGHLTGTPAPRGFHYFCDSASLVFNSNVVETRSLVSFMFVIFTWS